MHLLCGYKSDFAALVDFICTKFVEKNPTILQQYPVLEFSYNLDGSKKNILQLIEERRNLISENPDIDLVKLNDIYTTVANFRHLEESEVLILKQYIEKNRTYDEFIFNLLKFRLNKTKMTKEEKDNFIKEVYKKIQNTNIE